MHDCSQYVRRYPNHGSVNLLPSGKTRVRYRSNARTLSKTFDCECAATSWLDQLKDDAVTGRWSPTEMGEMTLEQWITRWSKLRKKRGKERKPKTLQDYETVFRLHVIPRLGDMPLRKFDGNTSLVLSFQDWLEDKLEDQWRTNEKAQSYTKWVLNYAQKKGAIRVNPFDDDEIYLPDVDTRREPVELEDADIARLAVAINPHYSFPVVFDAYMGLRSGEIWALRRNDYNRLGREIVVARSVQELTGKGLVLGTTKNGKSRRITVPAFLATQLDAYLDDNPGADDDWLFKSVKGCQVRHSNFMADYFRPAKIKAKLPSRTRFHDLRHFCAHFHISNQADPYAIMALLGHSSITVTMDIYGGQFDSARKALADKADVKYRERLAKSVENDETCDTNVTRLQLVKGQK